MTIYGWDASHYDGTLTRAILDRAYAEGIRFFTHKIAEGLQDTEGTHDDTALAAARDAGIPIIGGYLVPRSNATPADQVARWIALADAGEPWWRSFPGWFWQIDLERWSYDNVPASVGIDCGLRLNAATGRVVILYASRGQYGDGLAGWPGPLWNADYRGGPSYPGDGWVAADKGAVAGWAPYSGKTPTFLQFTSSATIAGLTTCDKNAYRGTVDDLRALIGGDMLTPEEHQEIVEGALTPKNVLHFRLRAFVDSDDPDLAGYYKAGWEKPDFDLKQIAGKLDGLAAGGAPTQEQVDAAVEKALPAALAAAGLTAGAIAKAVNDDAAKRLQD